MKSNTNLMLVIADVIPLDLMIDQLQEAITEHKSISSDESLKKVQMYCAMVAVKSAVKEVGGLDEATKKMNKIDEAKEFYDRMKI